MRGEEIAPGQIQLGGQGVRWAVAALAAGILGWLASAGLAYTAEHGVERFFRSYLVAFTYCLSIALGALFLVVVTHLTRAGWSVAVRRIAEVTAMTVVPLFLFGMVIYVGRHELYEWSHAEAVASDELLQHKAGYLNSGFFLIRIAAYFVIWGALAFYFKSRSVGQDESHDPRTTVWMERLAAPSSILFALTTTFASFDFLMSLYPHWYSTIYGVYYFAGCVVGSVSAITLMIGMLQRAGKLSSVVSVEHFHDLGKLVFAFVVFWAYIAFSQYMLIWIATIPEETQWYLTRQTGPWPYLSLFLLFGHFFVPFLWLMSRHIKRRRGILFTAAAWLLFMHWFDLFWLVMPESVSEGNPFHLLDLTTMVGMAGVMLSVVFWQLSRVRLVPVGDPRLEESLRLENV